MILAAGLLVLAGLGLFVSGLATGTTSYYWACVACCAAAAVLLIAVRLRPGSRVAPDAGQAPRSGTAEPRSGVAEPARAGARTPSTAAGTRAATGTGASAASGTDRPGGTRPPADPGTAAGAASPADAEPPVATEPPAAAEPPAGARSPGGAGAPAAAERRVGRHASADDGAAADVAADDGAAVAGTGVAAEPARSEPAAHEAPPAAFRQPATRGADDRDDPAEEDVEVTDLLMVVDMRDPVLVVDEHPRYHLADCSWLRGRDTIPLPVAEARSDGFTPCAVCSPDSHLADVARARRAASKK